MTAVVTAARRGEEGGAAGTTPKENQSARGASWRAEHREAILEESARAHVPSESPTVIDFLVNEEALAGPRKWLGAAVTDRLGGWVVLISVFAIWLVAITATFMAPSVDIFGYAWLLNSLAYTVTWGSIVQVIGAEYDAAGKAAQLAFCASASRFGASIGNIIFGQLLSAGLGWRQVCMPMLPVQALLLALCIYKWSTSAASAAAAPAAGAKKTAGEPAPSVAGAFLSVDFWLMLIPKAVLFTYTQFFMNYIPQLLHASYGYDHGQVASLSAPLSLRFSLS